MFTYQTQIRLHDTDAAGIIFFANQFKMIHDSYENLLESFGLSFPIILNQTHFFLPIVHATSDYKVPVFAGDKITITLSVTRIGTTSFSLNYTLKRAETLVGTAQTVHVAINQKTRQKIPLPENLRRQLEEYLFV